MEVRLCSIADCDKKHFARGWCKMHYNRWGRHGDPNINNTSNISLVSMVFNQLTVISKNGISRFRSALWNCLCTCGNIVVVSTGSLKSGNTKSCGCRKIEKALLHRKAYGESSFNMLYRRYKLQASRRNLDFILSENEFRLLISQNCFYCNLIPSQIAKGDHSHGNYIYNGIDRVDNIKGYDIFNCVSCCKQCNWSKKNLTKDEFQEWIKRLVNHNKELLD